MYSGVTAFDFLVFVFSVSEDESETSVYESVSSFSDSTSERTQRMITILKFSLCDESDRAACVAAALKASNAYYLVALNLAVVLRAR